MSGLIQLLGEFSVKYGEKSIKVGGFNHTIAQLCALFSYLCASLRGLNVVSGTEPNDGEVTTSAALLLKTSYCIARALDAGKKGVESVEIIPNEQFLDMGVSLARHDYLEVECQAGPGKFVNVTIGIPGMRFLN